MRKVCVVTGGRAEYGLLYWLLREIEADPGLELQLVATGMHLAERFGMTVRVIEDDGFAIAARVEMLEDGDAPLDIARSMGRGVAGMAEAFVRLAPDIVVVLGDRFEILAAATAATVLGVPLAHIHGGEITEGAIDDAMRHAITKMSHLHFTAAEPYRRRVIRMGEAPQRVFNVGAIGLDNIERLELVERPALDKELDFDLGEGFFVVTYHPQTLGNPRGVGELLAALDAFPGHRLLFTGVNADPGNRAITRAIADYVAKHPERARRFVSLGQLRYLSALKHCQVVIGNSSSGLIEAPALGVPTVNIGDRQKGRLRAASVIDCPDRRGDIRAAIERALSRGVQDAATPFGRGGVSGRIVEVLRTADLDGISIKRFADPAAPGEARIQVIAEAGVNHNGDEEMALRLVDAAAEAGADTVKFQTFKAAEVATGAAPKAAYQSAATDPGESQLAMLERLELSAEAHRALAERCRERGIDFLSTPFDLQSLRFLAGELGLETLKIPSGAITDAPLLLEAGRSGCRIILSTGMSTIEEVEAALGVLAFGMTETGSEPSRANFRSAYLSLEGKEALRNRVTLLHCTSAYPTPLEDVNLRAMDTLRESFDLPVGLSDHSPGIAVAIAAAGRGASVIEKHFTLERSLPGPDHQASLEPDQFAEMVAAIRAVERALGDGLKNPRPSELGTMAVARKSLVARRPIRAGETFSEDNLTALRPGDGVSPMEYWEWLGRLAASDLHEDETIRPASRETTSE